MNSVFGIFTEHTEIWLFDCNQSGQQPYSVHQFCQIFGLIIDETLFWDMQIDSISKKMRKNIGIIKHVRDSVPKESLTLLYETLVKPYFRYCSSAWGKCGENLIDKLQTLQNRAARVVSKIKFDETDHEQLLKSLGWLNICQLTDFDTTSLMFKISRHKSYLLNAKPHINITQDHLTVAI